MLPLLIALVCPPGMVSTGIGTCIDQFEWPNIRGTKPLLGLSALPEERDRKLGIVMDAEGLCASIDKRACTLREWRSACYGPGESKYPWGDTLPTFLPGTGENLACNADKMYRPHNGHRIYLRDAKEFQRLDQSEPSGSRESCRSESGAYDMVGNVEEWVRCKGPFGWCLVGRFWADPRSCDFAIQKHHPEWHYYETGTRCCADSVPANDESVQFDFLMKVTFG